MAPARDGVQIPVSIVYRKDFPRDGTAPLLSLRLRRLRRRDVAEFFERAPVAARSRFRLRDRARARRRRTGLRAGTKPANSTGVPTRSTISSTRRNYLIQQHYTGAGRLVAAGGSAGGTLTGAVANDAPELWGAIVAHVPFVDVLNTILDDTPAADETGMARMGQPRRRQSRVRTASGRTRRTIRCAHRTYPPMLVTAGLNDPRVTYWEAAKYVAKLRSLKTDRNRAAAEDQHGGRPRGPFGALRLVARSRRGVCVRADGAGKDLTDREKSTPRRVVRAHARAPLNGPDGEPIAAARISALRASGGG